MEGRGMDLCGLEQQQMAGCYKYGNELQGSVNSRYFSISPAHVSFSTSKMHHGLNGCFSRHKREDNIKIILKRQRANVGYFYKGSDIVE
jgi:hypothetical protein